MTVGTFLGYSLSPVPSNYLFIAYGLTSLPIALLAAPFFVGRLVSYAFWTRTASTIGDWLDWDWFESAPYFAAYFLLSQILLVPVIYAFTRLDWRRSLPKNASSGCKNRNSGNPLPQRMR